MHLTDHDDTFWDSIEKISKEKKIPLPHENDWCNAELILVFLGHVKHTRLETLNGDLGCVIYVEREDDHLY